MLRSPSDWKISNKGFIAWKVVLRTKDGKLISPYHPSVRAAEMDASSSVQHVFTYNRGEVVSCNEAGIFLCKTRARARMIARHYNSSISKRDKQRRIILKAYVPSGTMYREDSWLPSYAKVNLQIAVRSCKIL